MNRSPCTTDDRRRTLGPHHCRTAPATDARRRRVRVATTFHAGDFVRTGSRQERTKSEAAWAGWREFRVVQRRFEDAAQSQCSFYLQPVDGQPLPPFKPGQFLTFSLDVESSVGGEASRAITRCYSLSDRPDPAHYRVTIKTTLSRRSTRDAARTVVRQSFPRPCARRRRAACQGTVRAFLHRPRCGCAGGVDRGVLASRR